MRAQAQAHVTVESAHVPVVANVGVGITRCSRSAGQKGCKFCLDGAEMRLDQSSGVRNGPAVLSWERVGLKLGEKRRGALHEQLPWRVPTPGPLVERRLCLDAEAANVSPHVYVHA